MAGRSVVYRLQADIGQFKAQMAAAGASVKDAADTMTSATKEGVRFRAGLTQVGDTAGKIGIAAAAGLGATIKAAVDWESAWAGVQKTVDGTASQMGALEGELRNMARSLPASHQEIAAVAEAAGQLGVQRENVASFTETMIALGETTNLSADDAATSIARLTNVMKTAPQDVERVGASLVALGNNFATTEAEIITMSQRLSAAGAIAGLSESDVLGFAAALSSVGVEAEAGGTAMSKVFTTMRDAAIDGGPKLQTFASTAGMAADEFARIVQDDPATAINAFIQGLGAMNAQGQSTSQVFKDLGLTDQRLMRALLSTAEAGDLLTDSIAMSGEAWQENSALAEEFGKRLDTTASQVQISWNNIKDAGIDAGAAMLPVVEGAAKAVSTLAGAFQALPGPVKGAVGPLLGLTAVFGGGLWFTSKTISGIANMRQALSDLGGVSSSTSGNLGKTATTLGKVARMSAGVFAVGTAVGMLADNINRIDSTNLDRSLSALGRGEITDDIAEVIDNLNDLESWTNRIDLGEVVTLGGLFGDTTLDKYADNIEQVDQALAGLVETGDRAQALALFEELVAKSGISAEAAKKHFDAYHVALRNTDGAAGSASGGVAELGDEMTAAEQATEDFKSTLDALNAVLSGRAGLRDYQAALDDFTKSLKDNGKNFDINTEKGRANQAALDNIAQSALNVAENMSEADRQEFLSSAIRDIRQMARDMDLPKSEVRTLISLLKEANGTNASPTIRVQDLATQKIRGINAELASIDRSIDVYVNIRRPNAGGLGPQLRAEGGYITGPGTATSDSIPAYLSNGEYVIKAAAVQKYGTHMFDSLNAMRFADGGEVNAARRSRLRTARQALRADEKELKAAEKLLEAAVEQRDAAFEMRNAAQEAKDAFAAQVAGSFNNDLYGSGLAGAMLQLQADANDSRDMNRILGQLAKIGLDGAAFESLATSRDITTANQLLAGGAGQVAAFEAAFGARAAAQQRLGATAAAVVHPQEGIDRMTRAAREMNQAVREMRQDRNELRREIKAIEKYIESGAKKGISAGMVRYETTGRVVKKSRARAGK